MHGGVKQSNKKTSHESTTFGTSRAKRLLGYHGTMVPGYPGTRVPWCHGAVAKWCHGTTEPWSHGTMPLVRTRSAIASKSFAALLGARTLGIVGPSAVLTTHAAAPRSTMCETTGAVTLYSHMRNSILTTLLAEPVAGTFPAETYETLPASFTGGASTGTRGTP